MSFSHYVTFPNVLTFRQILSLFLTIPLSVQNYCLLGENHFLSTLSEKFQVTLTDKVLESDQGTALKAACIEFHLIHLACLRHLLVSLKYNHASYLIRLLLRAITHTLPAIFDKQTIGSSR